MSKKIGPQWVCVCSVCSCICRMFSQELRLCGLAGNLMSLYVFVIFMHLPHVLIGNRYLRPSREFYSGKRSFRNWHIAWCASQYKCSPSHRCLHLTIIIARWGRWWRNNWSTCVIGLGARAGGKDSNARSLWRTLGAKTTLANCDTRIQESEKPILNA